MSKKQIIDQSELQKLSKDSSVISASFWDIAGFSHHARIKILEDCSDPKYIAFLDVTREKSRLPQALESRYSRIFSMARDSLLLVESSSGDIIDANPAAETLYGYPLQELLTMKIQELMAQGTSSSLSGWPPPSGIIQCHHRSRDGIILSVEQVASSFSWDNKEVYYVAVRDITPRVTARQIHDRQQKLLTNLLEHIPLGVYVKDVEDDYRYRLWNCWAAKLTGVETKDILGKNDQEVFGPEVARFFHRSDKEIINTGEVLDLGEERFFNSEANTIIHVIKAPIIDQSGKVSGVLGLMEDITRRKELEEELHYADKMRALGQMASGITHDLNNQLSAVLGYVDLMKEDVKDKHLNEYIHWIKTGSMRAVDLVHQLLAFSRKETRVNTPVDIHQIIDEVQNILQRTIDKKITLKKELKAPSGVIIGDVSLLRNAVLNLGLNARDSMPAGGEIIFRTKSFVVKPETSGPRGLKLPAAEYICLEVCDTGLGIAEDIQSRIFEPFFSTKKAGSGLGLAAVYGTIKSHGGEIELISSPGVGTSFMIYLPAYRESEDLKESSDFPVRVPPKQQGILVIDDEEGVRSLLYRILTGQGFDVFQARNGSEALECYRAQADRIGLVLLDMNMPVMGGEETLALLRKINPNLVILIISGNSHIDSADLVLKQGAYGYIQKPISPANLLRWVRQALSGEQE